MFYWPAKYPDEVLDYKVDWADRLDGDTIASSVFSVVKGPGVIDSQSNDTTSATVWLSGGEARISATVKNHIVTSDGREMEVLVDLPIRSR